MLARMRAGGVVGAVVVGVEYDHLPLLRQMAEENADLWFSVGIHPNHPVAVEPTVERLCQLADHPRCVAIGETGIDLYHHQVAVDVQERRFRTHIRAAKVLDKPLIVHNREGDADTLRILQEEGGDACGGVLHCFSSDLVTAEAALALGFSISFSGNVTYKNSHALREVAARIPFARLLIETDAPYLTPVPHRGKRNEPAYVRHVAEVLCEVRGVELADLARQTTENARRLFGIQG